MNIRERQIKRAEDRLIDQSLRAGRAPLLGQIKKRVAQQFGSRPAGRPRFRPAVLQRNKPSDPEQFNQMFREIREDLETVTDDVFSQSRRMMALADYYETEKQRITRDLGRLGKRIDGLLERVQQKATKATVFDSFTDFTQVDFVGDGTRNIPATTAFVDLAAGETTLNLAGHGHALVDLSEAAARTKLLGTYKETRMEGHPENALNDHVNESWRQVVTRAQSDTFSLNLSVELPEPRTCNALIITTQMPKPAVARLLITADGETWKRVPITSAGQPLVWVFESQAVKGFQVEFTKSEPDYTNGTEYEYRFGAQRITLRSSAYQQEGALVSQPLPCGPVKSVTLQADQVIPPETSLRYYVAMEGEGPLQWQEVTPGKALVLATPPQHSDFLGHNCTLDSRIANRDLWSIGETSEPFDVDTLQLRAGEFMWLKDTLDGAVVTGHRPSMADFTGKAPATTYHALDDLVLDAGPGFTRYTLNVRADSAFTESFRLTREGCEATVYLNNEELRPSGDTYTYRFLAGWNQLAIYVSSVQGGVLTPRIAFADPSVSVFAHQQPMKRVGVEDLAHSPLSLDTFAVKGRHLIVGYNPAGLGGVRYSLDYSAPAGQGARSMRLMALFARSEKAEGATPRLRSYRLQVS